jgi:hypothetical protein
MRLMQIRSTRPKREEIMKIISTFWCPPVDLRIVAVKKDETYKGTPLAFPPRLPVPTHKPHPIFTLARKAAEERKKST